MRQNEPSQNEDTPRDPLLEEAFTHFVQQAQAPAEFAARVRARVLGPEGQPEAWYRRVATWLTPRRPGLMRPAMLVTCLMLFVLSVWLGMRLFGNQEQRIWVRLDLAEDVGLQKLGQDLGAIAIKGPLADGGYRVQVPLPRSLRLRGSPSGQEAPCAADPRCQLLEDLLQRPYVRDAELEGAPNAGQKADALEEAKQRLKAEI